MSTSPGSNASAPGDQAGSIDTGLGAGALQASGSTVLKAPVDVVEGGADAADEDGQDAVDDSSVPVPLDGGDMTYEQAERDAEAEGGLADGDDANPIQSGSEGEENQGGSAETSLKKKKKRKDRSTEEEQEEEREMTRAEVSQVRINAQIDAALSVGKKRPKKRRTGEDDLDQLADEEVERLKNDMIAAADADIEANEKKRPATEKLKLLPKVVNTLQKTHLQQSILDNNLLEGVKRWLEPLPDRSLPALNIQRQFFAILEKLHVDEISLKMSGLGKIVLFYSMCPRVDARIKRIAEKLIEVWSRPILKRSASYRTRNVPQSNREIRRTYRNEAQEIQAQIDPNRRHVTVPQAVQTGYTYAPRATAGAVGQEESHQARLINHKRLNEFKGKLKAHKKG